MPWSLVDTGLPPCHGTGLGCWCVALPWLFPSIMGTGFVHRADTTTPSVF